MNVINEDNIPTEGFKNRARDALVSPFESGSHKYFLDFFKFNYPYIESARTTNGEDIYLAATYTEMFSVCGTCHGESTGLGGAIAFPIYPKRLGKLEKILH